MGRGRRTGSNLALLLMVKGGVTYRNRIVTSSVTKGNRETEKPDTGRGKDLSENGLVRDSPSQSVNDYQK